MRRWLLLVLSVALAVLMFAPVAAARGGDDGGFDDRGMHARGTDDRGFDDKSMDARGADDHGFDDNVGTSPASSASASTSATSSASASANSSASPSASPSASASASPTASPTATATPALPDTGGFSSVSALGSLARLVGGGLLALGIVRRRKNTTGVAGGASIRFRSPSARSHT
jgi:hypothetical protein